MLFDDTNKLLLIAGPCAIENQPTTFAVAEVLAELREQYGNALTIIFKSSFDKANRTALSNPRGVGIDDGLALLGEVKKQFGFPVITDVHLPEQCPVVATICDALQIPAFLCRQTDLLLAAAKTGRTVNIKKGQFLAPQDMRHVVDKLQGGGAQEIWQTERGTTFGYHNLVVDMRSFAIMKNHGYPVIFDATHSVQLPGGGNGQSSGQREFVPPLARAACAAGANGLYIETHPDPTVAISDGPSQVPLSEFPRLVQQCLTVWQAVYNL